MKTSLAVLVFVPALLGASGARADHGPPPGSNYEVREIYDQQHYAGQGSLRSQARGEAAVVREPLKGKAQATKPARQPSKRPASGHGDW